MGVAFLLPSPLHRLFVLRSRSVLSHDWCSLLRRATKTLNLRSLKWTSSSSMAWVRLG